MKQEHLDFIREHAHNIMLGFTEVYGKDILESSGGGETSVLFSIWSWRSEVDCTYLAEVSTEAKKIKLELPWFRCRGKTVRTNTAVKIDINGFYEWIVANVIEAGFGDVGLEFSLKVDVANSSKDDVKENVDLLTYVVTDKKFPLPLMNLQTMAYVLYNHSKFDRIPGNVNTFKFKDVSTNNEYIGRMIADVANKAAALFEEWYLIQAFREAGCPLTELTGFTQFSSRSFETINQYEDGIYPNLDMGKSNFFRSDCEFHFSQLSDIKSLEFILKYAPKVSEFLIKNSYGLDMYVTYRGHGAFVTGMLAARNINELIDVFMFDDERPYSKLLANYFLVNGFEEFEAMYHKFNYPKQEY